MRISSTHADAAEESTPRASVSLIVLAFNHARYLPQLFASIEANLEDIRELIFIDNGSSDDSARLMQDFLATLQAKLAVRMFSNPPRTGATHAVNVALRAATFEYVAVSSADDYLLDGRFGAQLAAMRADLSLQFCYSNGFVCDEDGALSKVPVHNEATVALLTGPPLAIVHGLYYPVPTLFTQCALFKRSALLEVGGWDEDLVIDDWPLNLKLFTTFGARFRYVHAYVCAYRRHSANASKRRFRQYMGQKRVLQKCAHGDDLSRGLFALLAAQGLASLKRKQWLRARVFFHAAIRCKPDLNFVIHWVANEARQRLRSKRIR
jgi:glycosyltransferase involved in cell wall biosynthesis